MLSVSSMRCFAALCMPGLLHQIPDRSFMLFQRSKSVNTYNVSLGGAQLHCTRNPKTPRY